VPAAASVAAPTPNQPQPPKTYSPAQLDQMLAPIALYPDPLLGQILIASTYPLEVVEADRWLQQPGNSSLSGAALNSALDGAPWDPSIKSLVPFPQILQMMDTHLEWTEALGEAFLADQAGVMDAVQRLRKRAEAAGNLHTTSEEDVTNDGDDVVIEPPQSDYVYVPDCEAAAVYGLWPYPDYPPYDFAVYNGLAVGDFGCGWWGEAIDLPYWGWNRWDWHHRHLDIDRGRYTGLNGNHPPPGSGSTWQHDPTHRHDVPFANPRVRSEFGGGASRGLSREMRGFPSEGGSEEEAPRVSPEFESYGSGSRAHVDYQRGSSSRGSASSFGGGARGYSGGGGRPR